MNPAGGASRLDVLRQTAARHADSPQALFELANELLSAGELSEAIGCYRQAVALRADFPDAHNNMGVALRRSGQLEDAILAFGAALNLRLDYADAHNNLGNALCDKKDWDGAIACFQRAIALRPDFPDAHGNLGNALLEKGFTDPAIACYRRALSLRAADYGMLNNLANALCAKGELREAIATAQKSLAIKPDYPEAHLSLGLMHLLQGDLQTGWREYEWRWQSKEHHTPAPKFRQPRWDGSELSGQRILLHCEQALGDTLQFVRYAPLVAARGGKVIVAVQPELLTLLRDLEGVGCVVDRGGSLPDFDLHAPLMTLPGLLQTSLDSIPASIPYLRATAQGAEKWRSRMPADARKKVGLIWAGRPSYSQDRQRSISLSMFAPFAQPSNVWFCSLQKGPAARQAGKSPFPLADWTQELVDFADTAGLVANLDLIVTVDTAVAHLAGAMGKPVWLLLKYIPDWRWMLGRADSPWYPSMRLFRQTAAGDWTAPIAQAALQLKSL